MAGLSKYSRQSVGEKHISSVMQMTSLLVFNIKATPPFILQNWKSDWQYFILKPNRVRRNFLLLVVSQQRTAENRVVNQRHLIFSGLPTTVARLAMATLK